MNELVFELSSSARRFVPASSGHGRGAVRSRPLMNCYYSNLIEGHDTLPSKSNRRSQRTIVTTKNARIFSLRLRRISPPNAGLMKGRSQGAPPRLVPLSKPTTGLKARFLRLTMGHELKNETARASNPRRDATFDVQVGRHVPVSPGAIARFMRRWEIAYGKLNKFDTVLQAAAAHHRLVWIHPFADGNGRVPLFLCHALGGLNSGGIWSIARGLSRSEKAYEGHLAACDLPRRNDLDGRGSLSEETLAEFTTFFLDVCLDQVQFMTKLMQPNALRKRIMDWAKEEERLGGLLPHSTRVLAHILTHRELERKDVIEVVGFDGRKARRVTALLHKRGIITAPRTEPPSASRSRFLQLWRPASCRDCTQRMLYQAGHRGEPRRVE